MELREIKMVAVFVLFDEALLVLANIKEKVDDLELSGGRKTGGLDQRDYWLFLGLELILKSWESLLDLSW